MSGTGGPELLPRLGDEGELSLFSRGCCQMERACQSNCRGRNWAAERRVKTWVPWISLPGIKVLRTVGCALPVSTPLKCGKEVCCFYPTVAGCEVAGVNVLCRCCRAKEKEVRPPP